MNGSEFFVLLGWMLSANDPEIPVVARRAMSAASFVFAIVLAVIEP